MGRSYKPKYKAMYRDQRGWQDISWVRPATNEEAEKFRVLMNQSLQPGGHNAHLSEEAGFILHVSKVEVLTNERCPRVVASASAPMFEVF